MLTIGERIKYFRKQRGYTQAQLAELTGIHPVSIRKYETNKMQPQQMQIEKIAEALHVNSGAISGFHSRVIKLKTVGDLMGLLVLLHKSDILRIEGERGQDGIIKPDAARLIPNPILKEYLPLTVMDDPDNTIQAECFRAKLPKQQLLFLFRWEQLYRQYKASMKEYENTQNEKIKNFLVELSEDIERIEMELQGSMLYLSEPENS